MTCAKKVRALSYFSSSLERAWLVIGLYNAISRVI
jgi:hypothetical protein